MSGRSGRPRSRVQRLRRWLLASVIAFGVLLAVMIGMTRYRALKQRLNLPRQLGIDVKSEANSFTISRSTTDGRPLFTIHASKAIQHKNGITTLHDVAVTLYGPKGSNRTDSIRGGEFEYDQAHGIVRAMGETLLDVGIADGSGAPGHTKRLTMQSRGLVFLQKLGVASTKEQIRFQYGASQGEAVGADYDMDTGLLTLQHDVHLHSTENGKPERIDAASAELDRNTRIATLHDGTLSDADDSMHAPTIVASLRSSPDEHAGTLEKVDATGGVTLRTSAGERVDAPELHADVSPENKLEVVSMRGGVHVQDDATDATAQRAQVRFHDGHAQHLTLQGSARVVQSEGADVRRTLDAAVIESALQESGGARLSLRELHATGGAKLVSVEPAKQTGRVQRTELTSPTLIARMAPLAQAAAGSHGGNSGKGSMKLRDLEASKPARLLQDDGAGGVSTSTSDHLMAAFSAAEQGREQAALQSVVQDGHVVIHEVSASQKGGAQAVASQTDAEADRAEYQASTDLLVLTGSPHLSSDGVQMSANRLNVNRGTGAADAEGAVRGSFFQAKTGGSAAGGRDAEPTQFAGESAHLARSTGVVRLLAGGGNARLWSSAGQVEAPVITADQKANTLHASGAASVNGAAVVRTVLMQRPGTTVKATTDGATGAGRVPTRVFSNDLFYRAGGPGKPGAADFSGGVRLMEGDDVIVADRATAVIAAGSAGGGPLPVSGVEAIRAEGHVRVQQGARTATGAQLVYTVATREAVLTGSAGALPVVHDPMQGTLTGTRLLLHVGQGKGDNQVEVDGAPTAPVHTELEVPEKQGGGSSRSRAAQHRKPNSTP